MYHEKTATYFSSCRTDILRFVPPNGNNRILEIGAGSGETLLKAKETGLAGYAAGIDLVHVENGNQSNPAIDRFIIGNIEQIDLDFEENFFDVILCGDVLEHLIDPWECVGKLRALLRDGGCLIASIPNVRYWKTSLGLFAGGRWTYSDSGVLDRTHLRFFVRDSAVRLFSDAGFVITTVQAQGAQREWGFSAWALNMVTAGLLTDLLTVQYVIVARK